MTTASEPATLRADAVASARRRGGVWLLLAVGLAAFGTALSVYIVYAVTHPLPSWVDPVDLQVYRDGGLIVRHLNYYHPHRASPLYDWPGFEGLPFTYPPFAALVFTVLTLPSYWTLWQIAIGVNIAALLATIWMTFGALGYRRGLARLGATLLVAALLFWTEPVQRTLYLGQVELVLIALILWDQCQPDRRWWKGAGIGIAAGIKLVPLIFIPYLLLTRRFRQAGVASGVFAATVVLGFGLLDRDSRKFWLRGLFAHSGRTGFPGWEGNQSLHGIMTRLTGSIAGAQPAWLVVAALTLVVGMICAAVLDRAGHRMIGLLTCALTGLLASPISWDHHWVWIIPAVVVAVVYAVRAGSEVVRWTAAGVAAGIVLVFGAWPGFLWSLPASTGGYFEGLIWVPPVTDPEIYFQLGDRRWYAEYHWHGLQLITGNLYVLAGIVLFALLALWALTVPRRQATDTA
jgi:alpha-1,2-mannosyltransferase